MNASSNLKEDLHLGQKKKLNGGLDIGMEGVLFYFLLKNTYYSLCPILCDLVDRVTYTNA